MVSSTLRPTSITKILFTRGMRSWACWMWMSQTDFIARNVDAIQTWWCAMAIRWASDVSSFNVSSAVLFHLLKLQLSDLGTFSFQIEVILLFLKWMLSDSEFEFLFPDFHLQMFVYNKSRLFLVIHLVIWSFGLFIPSVREMVPTVF